MALCVSPGGTCPLPRGRGGTLRDEHTWPSRDPGPQAIRILADAHAAVRTWEELVWNPRPGGPPEAGCELRLLWVAQQHRVRTQASSVSQGRRERCARHTRQLSLRLLRVLEGDRQSLPSLAVTCAPQGQLSLLCGKGGAQQDLCPRGLCCEPETTCSVLTGLRGQSPRQEASNHMANREDATRAPRSEAPPQAHTGPHGCTWLLTLPEAPASASPGAQAHGTCRSRTSWLTRSTCC